MKALTAKETTEIKSILERLKTKTQADGHLLVCFSQESDGPHITLISVGTVPSIPECVAGIVTYAVMSAYSYGRDGEPIK